MLRVDLRRPAAGTLEFLISGTLDADQVAVVREAIQRGFAQRMGITLNLGGLIGLDLAGCRALAEWRQLGARLVASPAFVRRWIQSDRLSRIRGES